MAESNLGRGLKAPDANVNRCLYLAVNNCTMMPSRTVVIHPCARTRRFGTTSSAA